MEKENLKNLQQQDACNNGFCCLPLPAIDIDFFDLSVLCSRAVRVNNIWTNIISSVTGESVNYEVVTTWLDGSAMDDSKTDGYIYRKRGNEYLKLINDGLINVAIFGAKGDGVTDDQEAINKALSFGDIIFDSSKTYLIGDTINVPSDRCINLNGATIRLQEFRPSMTPMFRIESVENVHLYGGVLNGDNANQSSTGGPDGGLHGVSISGNSKGIMLSNLNIHNCDTDGVYIKGVQGKSTQSVNIILDTVICDSNKRQGLSIIWGKNISCNNCQFINTKGKSPQAGVDIESNQSIEDSANILFSKCQFSGNSGRGLMVNSKAKIENITIKDCVFENNNAESIVFTGLGEMSNVLVDNVIADDCLKAGVNTNTGDSYDINILNSDIRGVEIRKSKAFVTSSIIRDSLKVTRSFILVAGCTIECESDNHSVSIFGEMESFIMKNSILKGNNATTTREIMYLQNTNILIENCLFYDSHCGLRLQGANAAKITGNTFINFTNGVYLNSESSNVIIKDNSYINCVKNIYSSSLSTTNYVEETSFMQNRTRISRNGKFPSELVGVFNVGDTILNRKPSLDGHIGWILVDADRNTWLPYGKIEDVL